MPNVPQVEQQALPNVRVSTDAPIEAFGGGASRNQAAQATQGLAGEAGKIFLEERDKADQVAHLGAQNQMSKAQTDIQVQVSQMKGADALQANQFASEQWQKAKDSISGSLNNPRQQAAFEKSSASQWQDVYKTTEMHVAGEKVNLDKANTQSAVQLAIDNSAQNSFDPNIVAKNREEIARQVTMSAQRTGTYLSTDGKSVSPVFQAQLADATSSHDAVVIQNMLDNDHIDGAKAYLDQHKDTMTAGALNAATMKLEHTQVITQANGIWNEVQHWTLSDGVTPNEAKMESSIRARTDMSDQRKEQVIRDVKARAKEELSNRRMQNASNENSMLNEAIQMRKSGAPLVEAMKLAGKYSKDSADLEAKTAQIQKMYAPPAESDPGVFNSTFQAVYNGTAKEADIDKLSRQNMLNAKDTRSLKEQLYKTQQEGINPAQKLAFQTIETMAESDFSDKKKRDQFLSVVKREAQGKSPQELIKSYQDLRKDIVTDKGWLWDSTDTAWKIESKKLNAQDIGWGTVHQDVGSPQTAAISKGISRATGKPVELKDVQAFSEAFGGYDHIKAGTPVNAAISSLSKQGKLVNQETVKQVLQRYPDGNVPDGAFKK